MDIHDSPPTFRDTRAQDVARGPATKNFKRWLWPALLSIVALWLAIPVWRWLAAGGQAVRLSEQRIGTVQRADFNADVSGYAQVVAARAPTLYAAGAGTVSYQVEAGQSVEVAQLLAEVLSPELDNRLMQERSLLAASKADAAMASIENERAVLAKERARDEAQIRATAATREFERAQKAMAKNAISEVEFKRAADLLQASTIETKHAGRELELERRSMQEQSSNRRAQVERQALVVAELERQQEALQVRAAFAGVVGDRLQSERAQVAANAPLLTLVDLSEYELDMAVSEIYAQRLSSGLAATVERGEQRLRAELKRVSPEITDGQIKLRLKLLDAAPSDLKQNQRLLVAIELDQRAGALTIERGPFLDEMGGQAIWRIEDDMLKRTAIEMGLIGSDRVEILSGLKEGDRVVLSRIDADPKASRLFLHQ
jgi:HlyD family secretion protein